MKKIKKLNKNRIISLFLLVCLITITLTFAIYRESISKLLNINVTHPSYTVTFDANGGSVSTASKSVTYGHEYGTLPTPTRDGYTFKGWNGKNMFNISEGLNSALVDNNDGTYTIWKNSSSDRFSNNINIHISKNTVVTVNFEIVEYNGTYSAPFQIVGNYQDGSTFYSIGKGKRSFLKDTKVMRIYQETSMPIGTYTTFKNLMIEEGSTASAYEPYYITSSTEVVQAQDHTLKAIWEPNTYTVSFNKNDNSASGSMTSIGMTYGESVSLPSNSFTKTGYKFVGWNTKADGSGTTYSDGASVSNLTTTNNATVTLYAQWKRVMANNVEYDEPEVNCNNVQCMIDELYDMLY